tara:strand:+ start:2821 stop:4011 length:1191 start_codon:yes stop_codon:yes gene_type:complete
MSPLSPYAQIVYESGYLIDETGQRTECLIKNIDWKNTPLSFKYKLNLEADIHEATLQNTREFGIYGQSRFIKATVDIDKSIENTNNLRFDRSPDFETEQLFLQVIIDGDVSLFYYHGEGLIRFFYQPSDSLITQLVYKPYLKSLGEIAYNNYYKQQLYLNLKCKAITTRDAENLFYTRESLKRLFIKYHKCKGLNYKDYDQQKKKDLFNLTLRPGLYGNHLNMENSYYRSQKVDFGDKYGIRLGLEAEFILPFHKNKWAITIEAAYQQLQAEKNTFFFNAKGKTLTYTLDYNHLEVPVGIRHYLYLTHDSKILLNVAYSFNFSSNSGISITEGDGSEFNFIKINSPPTLCFGAGYKFRDRYSIEFRYALSRDLVNGYDFWTSEYTYFAATLGYTLF